MGKIWKGKEELQIQKENMEAESKSDPGVKKFKMIKTQEVEAKQKVRKCNERQIYLQHGSGGLAFFKQLTTYTSPYHHLPSPPQKYLSNLVFH